MLGIRDRALALDFDCALATRVQIETEAAIEDVTDGNDDGAFFALIVTLLRALT